MYKFGTLSGSCGNPVDLAKAEKLANEMAQQGWILAHVFQSTTRGCLGTNSAIVMIFKQQ
jgi:hypothetical protein